MKSYQVRFTDEALSDLGNIFADLLPVAGEYIARILVGRLESAIIILQHAMNQLRNHAMFDEVTDPAVLHAAHHLSATLEDRRKEMEQVIDQVERKG